MEWLSVSATPKASDGLGASFGVISMVTDPTVFKTALESSFPHCKVKVAIDVKEQVLHARITFP
ncbi:hypothetical protein [Bradyrhizobium sp. Tv2a-2]|uniref:hypothetical protein n=1 Tax=Bradyrhizobium sp. Tv2a-2 TaxID=113395 RepID=UPI0003FDD821|nr:hypothetical protein [Bradyrhizobium sp. Tv2a-2]